jgi:glycosyltransferase involved in cell wall biosynthesis
VLFLARIGFKKGLDILIEAMKTVVARSPGARLAIAGPPDPAAFGDQVREWVTTSGIPDHITLTGSLGPHARLEALADADVFTLPSYAENFGFSIFEAMASRVPVVVSDTLNYAGEIAAAGAGLSVPRTPEDVSAAVVRLINQPELRREMGENGLRLARLYSWDKCGERLEQAIESILLKRSFSVGAASSLNKDNETSIRG